MKMNIETIIKDYNITCEKTPILIGVYGTKGKTSVITLLESYLKMIGKNVISFSSLNATIIDVYSKSILDLSMVDRMREAQGRMRRRLIKAIKEDPDFIILELHENPANNRVFDELLFDQIIVTKVDAPFNSNPAVYFKSSLEKILDNENYGTTIVESFFAQVEWEEWLKEKNLSSKLVRYFNRAEDSFYEDRGRSIPDYKPTAIARGLNRFVFELKYNKKYYNIDLEFPSFFYSYNIFAVIASTIELGLFDISKFRLLSNVIECVPGRGELIQISDSRNVLIDFNGEDFIRFLKMEYINHVPSSSEIVLLQNLGYNPDTFFIKPKNVIMLTNFQSQFKVSGETIPDEKFEISMISAARTINNSKADSIVLTRVNHGATDIETAENYLKNNIYLPLTVIHDRKEAIKQTISKLKDGDLLVITRRGSETNNYNSDLQNEPYSDIDIVNEWFEENM